MLAFFRMIILFSITLLLPLHVGANDSESTTLLLFGDSIVAGYGVQSQEALPAQLQSILNAKGYKVTVINGGVSGDTTSGGRSRLNWALDKFRPDMVVLALGGNDLLRGVPPKVTRENIDAMTEKLAQEKVKTIVSKVQAPASLGRRFQQEFDSIYSDAAARHNMPLYPFFLVDTYGNSQLMQQDGIHPNPAGAKLIAQKLAEYLIEEDQL